MDPKSRFTAREALNHPFITQHCGSVDIVSTSAILSDPASPGRPLGSKTSIDDSACITSNEKISKEKTGSGEKLSKKGGIFGKWFKGKTEN